MSDAAEHEVVQEVWSTFQVSVGEGEGLEISILPGFIPCHGVSKTMFLVTNRYPRKILDLHAEAKLLEAAPGVRPGVVAFRQRNLLPGEVSFGTIEITTASADPGDLGLGLAVAYRLAVDGLAVEPRAA